MTAADYRNEAFNCLMLARIAKTQAEKNALRAEGGRLTTMAEQMAKTGGTIRIQA